MTSYTVLGAQGRIGRALVAALRAQGLAVFAPQRDDPALFTQELGWVIDAAGITADFRQRPHDTVQAHVCRLGPLLQRARFEGFLYLSSTRVYAGSRGTCESTPLQVNPLEGGDLYNLSKLLGEALCLNDARPTVKVARLSNVVSPGDDSGPDFVPSLWREARRGRIVLRSAPDSAKDYLHLADVCELLPRLAQQARHRLVNLASGRQTTHAQWVAHIAAHTGCEVAVAPCAPMQGFAPIDTTRLRELFDFQPRPIFDEEPACMPTP